MTYLVFLIVSIVLDQISKIYALDVFQNNGTYPIFKDVFHLTLAKNTGAAFSIFKNNQWFLIILSMVLIIVMLGLFVKAHLDNKSQILQYALLLVSGGALGNLIDRFRLGYVVDFFDFRLINFPIFNVADVFICIGMAVIAILVVFFNLEWP